MACLICLTWHEVGICRPAPQAVRLPPAQVSIGTGVKSARVDDHLALEAVRARVLEEAAPEALGEVDIVVGKVLFVDMQCGAKNDSETQRALHSFSWKSYYWQLLIDSPPQFPAYKVIIGRLGVSWLNVREVSGGEAPGYWGGSSRAGGIRLGGLEGGC